MKAIDGPADEPRRRGRPKVSTDEDKRVQIVEVARRVFVKYGYAGSTTAVVASEAGVSKQTLYRLFESKEELFAAVVAAHRRLMLDLPRPAEDCSIAESLERIFMLDMDEDRDADRAGFLQLVFREAAQFPELVDILQREGMLASRQELADWLSDRRAERVYPGRSGKRRPDADGHDLRRHGTAGGPCSGLAQAGSAACPSSPLNCDLCRRHRPV
uniref:CasR n=1 Tax=Rhizobium etli TaxID=29449 RepID=Q9F6W0_RHIET|nr:CasR [Rhizobium etli]